MKKIILNCLSLIVFSLPTFSQADEEKTEVLIVDGFSNHDWKQTTLVVKSILEKSGLFRVTVSTSPSEPGDEGWNSWKPVFDDFDVVIQNSNNIHNKEIRWPREVEKSLEDYVKTGGGLFVLHSANNAFAHWPEYNLMIGLGWRSPEQGIAIQVGGDGQLIEIPIGEGRKTYHGPRNDEMICILNDHPINRDFPEKWLTPNMELYKFARGPAENLTVLSYARDDETDINWPVEWTVAYGKGRVYNSSMGHLWKGESYPPGYRCVGFQTTIIRATEWLATGFSSYEVPDSFPTESEFSLQESDLPNIVVFLVDDMGLMDSSVPFITDGNGNPVKQALNDWYQTPNMQRLANQGIRFSNFYAHTVCSPTRASLMTGQNSARHRTTNWIRPDRNNKGDFGPDQWNWEGLSHTTVTLPHILQHAGYKTIHIGKAHFGPLNTSGSDPLNLGFDVNIGGGSYGQPGSYYGKDGYGHIKGSRPHAVPHLEKYHGKEIYLTEALTREARSEIEKSRIEEKPFYLYMSHYAVHAPFQADHRFMANYADSDKSVKAEAFATMIEGMDQSLGELMDLLNDLGIAENTLIFFMGDNGSDAPLGNQNEIACSAPLRGKKGSKWEGGTRVPFIAAWAKCNPENKWQKKIGIRQGGIQEQPGYCYDIFPTVLELLDTPLPENHILDGGDLSILLSGKKDKSRTDKFLSHFPHWHRSNMFTTYRSGDWKIIYHYFPEAENMSTHYLLYNLKDDPSESHDLAVTYPEKVRELMLEMLHELESKSALFPVKDGVSVRPVVPEELTEGSGQYRN